MGSAIRSKAHPRGQALLEFALVLPLLLTLLVGGFFVGLAVITRLELTHAVIAAADAGAGSASQPQRCATALEVLAAVYGRPVQDATCVTSVDQYLEVSGRTDLPIAIPFVEESVWTIRVTERAVIR